MNCGSSFFMPEFSHIYVEKDAEDHPRTREILGHFPGAAVIPVGDYHEVFNRKRQSPALQARSRALILARNRDALVHKGSPVCQSFDNRWFYYCSSAMNCLYDCEYCWLRGMYGSGNLVIFVNLEDIFREVEKLLREHPVYLCASFDTDLLLLDPITGYARRWAEMAEKHRDLLVEIRTKGTGHFPDLAVSDRLILAFTMTPEKIAAVCEKGSPPVSRRIGMAQEAAARGFPLRLCFDPILVVPGWKEAYRALFYEFDRADLFGKVRDVSIGTFRLSADYMKKMRAANPDSALLQYPYEVSGGFYHLPDDLDREALDFVSGLLRERIPEEKIFRWREI